MDWVCGDSWKVPLTQGIHFAGGAVGTLLFGLFADRFGRLPRYKMEESKCIWSNSIILCGSPKLHTTFIFDNVVPLSAHLKMGQKWHNKWVNWHNFQMEVCEM